MTALGCLCLSMLLASTTLADDVDDAKKELKRAVRSGDPALIGGAIEQLGATKEAEAAELILKVLPHIRPEDVLDQLVAAFVQIGSEKLDPIAMEVVGGGRTHPDEIALIFLVAEKLNDSTSEKWLLAGLESPIHLVLRNATEQLVKRKSREAVGKLIEQLKEATPRTTRYFTIREALYDLTGEDFDLMEDWDKFWEINKDTFDPAKVDQDTGHTKVKREKSDDGAEFFGVEIRAQRVMFVIDVSGSMRLWDEGGREAGGSGASWQNRQRIRRVKQQLSQSIAELNKGSRFNIVSYSHRVQIFNDKGVVPATSSWKSKALKWVKGFQPQGATHTDEALTKAFEDRTVDTIVLLSDGAPWKGQGTQTNALMDQIVKDVQRLNKLRKVKIYTFGFDGPGRFPPNENGGGPAGSPTPPDQNPLVQFLKRLAEENGGEYTSID